jgi:hypothetical protein
MYFGIIVVLWLLLGLSTPLVDAWGRSGHYLIGEATFKLLSEETRSTLIRVTTLDTSFNSSMGTASIWADIIKYTPRYAWTRVLHYYDNEESDPPTKCDFHAPSPKEKKNIIRGIQNFTDTYVSDKRLNTLMNIHLLQDLHQPLHLAGKARGGNGVMIPLPPPSTRNVSLHEYWDVVAVNALVNRYYGNMTNLVSDLILPPEGTEFGDTIDKTFRLMDCNSTSIELWAAESERRNCQYIWRDTYDSEYYAEAPDHVFDLMKLSTWRSACYLTNMLKESHSF